MIQMDGDEKYLDIRDKLKNLEQVKASDNFVDKLNHKIVELEAEKRKMHAKKFDEGRGGFLRNLFANQQYPWLIPSAGFTIIIFFVFYITFLSKNQSENNKEQFSTQNTEQTQNNSSAKIEPGKTNEDNEAPVSPDKSSSTSGKENPLKDEIAGDFKKEQSNKPLSQIETKKQESDEDGSKDEIDKTETFAQNEKENTSLLRESNKTENIENNGLIGIEESSRESAVAKEEKVSDIAPEDEIQKKKLIKKLNAMDKTNLENLRDKILND